MDVRAEGSLHTHRSSGPLREGQSHILLLLRPGKTTEKEIFIMLIMAGFITGIIAYLVACFKYRQPFLYPRLTDLSHIY